MSTKEQVIRWYNQLHVRMARAYPGQSFGFDAVTLASTGGRGWLDAITRLKRMFEVAS